MKLTQSNAILRYIARKNDLLGKTEAERIRVDILAEQSMDFRNGIVRLAYNAAFVSAKFKIPGAKGNLYYLDIIPFQEQLKPEYEKNVEGKLNDFSKFLGDNQWFAGENITFPDFVMYELLDQHRIMSPDLVAKFPKLVDFLNRFEQLPRIAAYMKSDRFLRAPINNKMAKFGGQ